VMLGDEWKVAAQRDPCLLDYGATRPARDAQCQPQSDTPAIALIGDSHAAALAANVADYARRQQKPLFQLTKASCPFLLEATRAMPQKPQ
ncbi:SGNH hydrolase domain-containing protein, partial [Klebsiella pneumoniae]